MCFHKKVMQNINFSGNKLKYDARENHLTNNLELKIRPFHQRYISTQQTQARNFAFFETKSKLSADHVLSEIK